MRKILMLLLLGGLLMQPGIAQLPNFTQTDCDNVTHTLYDDLAAGKAVVMKFCAVWCAPCAYSNPPFQHVWEKYGSGNCNVKMYSMLIDDENPGNPSDCVDGVNYANHYNLTMPTLTNIHPMTALFSSVYDISAIPTTLVIIPNQQDPANSTVYSIVGALPNLDEMIQEKLELGGFLPPEFKIFGNLCSDPPYSATLTSNFATGNLWSTGATTQSINVTHSGEFSLTVYNGGCGATSTQMVEFNTPFTIGMASTDYSAICQGAYAVLNYSLPAGSPDDVVWLMKSPGSAEWYEWGPADEGPIQIYGSYHYAPGSQLHLKVRARNGNHSSCEQFSNEIIITISADNHPVYDGTASISTPVVCFGSPFQLTYSGGLANSYWEKYDPVYGSWEAFALADAPVDPNGLTILNQWSYYGYSSDQFRVKTYSNGCYSVSNTVQINYHLASHDPIVISGPESTCGGTNLSLSVPSHFTDVVWSTGASTYSIDVAPDVTTSYTVSATNSYGCTVSDNHIVSLLIPTSPVIKASPNSIVCPGSTITLSFDGYGSAPPCTTAEFSQWPEENYTISSCNGNAESITEDGYLSEYSVVNVEAGKYYKFTSSSSEFSGDIIITIASNDGLTVYASGLFKALWKSDVTGPVRFYTHTTNCGGGDYTLFNRSVACYTDASVLGSFLWMPGGETTESIIVSPTSTTNYSLQFTETGVPCSATTVKQVIIGIGSVELTTTNITTNSAVLNWTSGNDPQQWLIRYKATNKGSKWTELAPIDGSLRSYLLTPLSDNQDYIWQIKAQCGKKWTDYSYAAAFKTSLNDAAGRIFDMITEAPQPESKIGLLAMPNPSNTNFRLSFNSNDFSEPVKYIVSDILGREIESRTANAGQVITIGDKFRSGIYIVRVIQGRQTAQVKLVKL